MLALLNTARVACSSSFTCVSKRLISSWWYCISFSMSTTFCVSPCVSSRHSCTTLRASMMLHCKAMSLFRSFFHLSFTCTVSCLANFESLIPSAATLPPLGKSSCSCTSNMSIVLLQPWHRFFLELTIPGFLNFQCASFREEELASLSATTFLSTSGVASIGTGVIPSGSPCPSTIPADLFVLESACPAANSVRGR